MNYQDCDECLLGSVWKINDSGREFVVVHVGISYVYVDNMVGPTRRRRILLGSLKHSRAKNGYTRLTRLSDGAYPQVPSEPQPEKES